MQPLSKNRKMNNARNIEIGTNAVITRSNLAFAGESIPIRAENKKSAANRKNGMIDFNIFMLSSKVTAKKMPGMIINGEK